MPKKRPPQKPIKDPYIITNYTSWLTPKPSPAIEHFDDEPLICVTFSAALTPYLIGLLETVKWLDKWQGSSDDKARMVGIVNELQDALIGGNCMPDPCCPEEIEILNDIKTAILAISTNLEISIENDTTIINQNGDVIYQQLVTQYNQFVSSNNSVSIYNSQIYDGNPQSISPNLGDDFDSGDGGEGKLCAAIDRYVSHMIYMRTVEVNSDLVTLGLITSAVAAIVIGGLSLGLGAAAGATLVAGAFGAALTAWNVSVQDAEAKRKVLCCMFDSLKDSPIDQAAFKASVNDCSFDVGTNESNIAALIDGQNQADANYIAFLRMLGETTSGNAADCACDCENGAEIVTTGVYGNVVTNMGNCIWRTVQSTPIEEPAGSGIMRYYHEWKDLLDRCILVEHVPVGSEYVTQATSDWFQTDCDDEEDSGIGGGGGAVKKMGFRMGSAPQYYKITLVE